MTPELTPALRQQQAILLTGIMAVYATQAEASEKIPGQLRTFLTTPMPAVQSAASIYGASPCTGDRKIHYLCGVEGSIAGSLAGYEQLLLPAGEYAIVTVHETEERGNIRGWILNTWLPASRYKERSAPEFEQFTKIRGSSTVGVSIQLGIPIQSR